MNRVILKEQQKLADQEDAEKDEELEKETSNLKITRTYQEALNLFLPPGRNPPREIGEDEEIEDKSITGEIAPSESTTNLLMQSESSTQLLTFSESSTQLSDSFQMYNESPIKDEN